MKKIKYIVILFIIILLTGCVQYNTTMKINDDKSVDLHMRYGMSIQVVDNSDDEDEDYIDEDLDIKYNPDEDEEEEIEEKKEEKKEKNNASASTDIESYKFLKEYGYSIEEYSEKLEDGSTSTGVDISKKFKSLDIITSDSKVSIDFVKLFSNDKGFDDSKLFYKEEDKYSADFIFNFELDEGQDAVDLKEYADMFDLKYSITFPEEVKYITSNATKTSKDGKTLYWDFEVGKVNEVKFSFSYKKYISKIDAIIVYSCLGVIGVSILLIIIVSLTKLGDKKKIKIEDTDTEIENNQEEKQ